jgi:hypothetical protein
VRRHDFTPLFLFLALILGLALFAMCGFFNWGVGFAHVTKGECDTLYAACMSRVVPGEEPSPTPPAPVPPGPPSDTKPDWQCYLDRYEHVRVHKASGRVMPYTEAWAKRHWEGEPGRWGGKHEGLTFECEEAGEEADISAKLPWHHSNQSGSFGTSVNLCEQYDAKAVNLNGTEWRDHRRDKGREVWHDPQMRDGMSGTITVELESGQVITAELTPGTGIRYSGDC